MTRKARSGIWVKTVCIVAAVVLVIVLGSYYVTASINSKIADYNILNIGELGEHDRMALYRTVNDRWNFLDAVADVIETEGISSVGGISDFLYSQAGLIPGAKRLSLMDENGDLYASNGTIIHDDEVFNAYTDAGGERFAVRYNTEEAIILDMQTTFLNSMSHDIRTPMNAILGFTALAAKHIDDKEAVAGYLGKIGQSGDHLMSLINDVLDMSRIESGKMTLNESEESLPEILKALRNIVQADMAAKQLEFFIDAMDVEDEIVVCDKLRLDQILLNILSNAIKYTQPGGSVALRIIEKERADESGYAHFEFRVKDNGIGMSEEFRQTIFDPFTREKTSTVSGIQGTGLGMAITKNIVDMMGGTISVASKVKEGSEFTVSLAFKTVRKEQKEAPPIVLNGLRGMVVDDDMNTCQSVSQMLRQIGMRAEWCMYGREAVARTEEAVRIGDRFKVYIIDWLMPDMNGIETARRIRRVVGDDVPIIILTAYDWADIEEEAREAGVTHFVSKPLFRSDLQKMLREACGEKTESTQESETAWDFTGRKILLVEDNELNREIATEILEEAGFVIDTAEDGTVAVEKMRTCEMGRYDLILMDIQMPMMDGYEATRAIRALPDMHRAHIPIIAMTANAFEEDRKNALEAGMNGHVAKPIEVDKLFGTLREVLR